MPKAAVPIVGRFFGANASLSAYLQELDLARWQPDFVVLHNTGNPTLAMRPHGFDTQTIANLAHYYAGLGWHAGPHFFVDQQGIWVFSSPEAPGVHSPSWNHISWGVELLGDYERDGIQSGAGAKVYQNGLFLLAALHQRARLDSQTLRFHKEDPLTTHKECPGRHIIKADVIAQLHARLAAAAGNSRRAGE